MDLNKLLDKVFGLPDRKFLDSDSPETIANWDSFQSLILFQELESAAGVSFELADLQNVKTVGDLKRLLEKYKVNYV